jgi:lipoyl synthase
MSVQFPPWLKKRISYSDSIGKTREILKDLQLNTVCQSAGCPNLCECFANRQATFMILGNICTRDCGFCAVEHGTPETVDREETKRIAQGANKLGLQHIIITSVTRDDLEDGGANQFVEMIKTLKSHNPKASVEVLTPDFAGDYNQVEKIVQARPAIFSHNVETIPDLYPKVRPQAQFARSLKILRIVKDIGAGIYTKSGIMVGLGETKKQVRDLMMELKTVGCDILTIGQYLQPTQDNLPVVEFITPEVFDEYKQIAKDLGFIHVEAGPFVRSSYQAWNLSLKNNVDS